MEWYRLSGGFISGSDVALEEVRAMCAQAGLKTLDQYRSIFYVLQVSRSSDSGGSRKDEADQLILSPVLIEFSGRAVTLNSFPENPSGKRPLELSTQFLLGAVGGSDVSKWTIKYVGRPACSPNRLPELVLNQLRYRVMHHEIGSLEQEKNTLVVEEHMATFANVVKMETLARRINPGDQHRLPELGPV